MRDDERASRTSAPSSAFAMHSRAVAIAACVRGEQFDGRHPAASVFNLACRCRQPPDRALAIFYGLGWFFRLTLGRDATNVGTDPTRLANAGARTPGLVQSSTGTPPLLRVGWNGPGCAFIDKDVAVLSQSSA